MKLHTHSFFIYNAISLFQDCMSVIPWVYSKENTLVVLHEPKEYICPENIIIFLFSILLCISPTVGRRKENILSHF